MSANKRMVVSALPDLSDVPLDELPWPGPEVLDEALRRVITDTEMVDTPFNSAI